MKPVLMLLLAVLLLSAADGSPRRRDLSGRELTILYNMKVIKAEVWKRPLANWEFTLGYLKHNGVVVTTADGKRWLVHKGPNEEQKHKTVITSAFNMGPSWEKEKILFGLVIREKTIHNSIVDDYIEAGGSDYSWNTDNCQHATERMWRLN